MEPITNNEFLNSVLEAEAWKEISDNESLSMDILDKYADKLDWDEISENRNVIWTRRHQQVHQPPKLEQFL